MEGSHQLHVICIACKSVFVYEGKYREANSFHPRQAQKLCALLKSNKLPLEDSHVLSVHETLQYVPTHTNTHTNTLTNRS